jgi:hypothetical protein
MFQALQLEVMERFTAVEQYFRKSRRFEGDPSQTARGLVFVQIYAIHEYTMVNVTRIATNSIAAHAHTYAELRPSLLALFLDPELCSLRDCGPSKIWDRRIDLLQRATSNQPVLSAAPPLPMDGSHFRHTHVELILRVLGVTRKPTRRLRHLHRIDEVVEKRNLIAHGEETAAAVGRGYSREDIWNTIRQMKSNCLRMIFIVSEHCNDPVKHCR